LSKSFFIDPGSSKCGYVIFQDDVLWDGGKVDNETMTTMIYTHKPSLGVLELPKTYRANPYMDLTLIATGRLLEALDRVSARVVKIERRDVLKILFGCVPSDGKSGRNNDKEVYELMNQEYPKAWHILGPWTSKDNDDWQALGLREAHKRSFDK
jgi:hypothetical protein